jgi:hypothetical protein
LDPQQRFGAIAAPRIVGSASAWLPIGCAESLVMRLPDNYDQAARDTLAHRPSNACGSRRSLAVVPLIGDKRYYGESPVGLWRGLPPCQQEWAGRVAVGEGPEAGLLGEPKHPTSNIKHQTARRSHPKPPQCDPKATPMRPQSHPNATTKPPRTSERYHR